MEYNAPRENKNDPHPSEGSEEEYLSSEYIFVGEGTPPETDADAQWERADVPLLSFTSSSSTSSSLSIRFFRNDSSEEDGKMEGMEREECRLDSSVNARHHDHHRCSSSRRSTSTESSSRRSLSALVRETGEVYDVEDVAMRYEHGEEDEGVIGFASRHSLLPDHVVSLSNEEEQEDEEEEEEENEEEEEQPIGIQSPAKMNHFHTPGTFVFSQYHESRFTRRVGNSRSGYAGRKRERGEATQPPSSLPAKRTRTLSSKDDMENQKKEEEDKEDKHGDPFLVTVNSTSQNSAIATHPSSQRLDVNVSPPAPTAHSAAGTASSSSSQPQLPLPHSQQSQGLPLPLPPPHSTPRTARRENATPSSGRANGGSTQSVLLAKAAAWCPWGTFDDSPTTLEGWGLPQCVVEQWRGLGVHQLHLWQRACLFDFCEHVATGLHRCAEALQQRSRNNVVRRTSLPPAADDEGTNRAVEADPLPWSSSGQGKQGSGPPAVTSSSFSSSRSSLASQRHAALWADYPSHNLVYSAPTSGGKALLSDILVLRTLLGVTQNGVESGSSANSSAAHSSRTFPGVSSPMRAGYPDTTQLHCTTASASPTANSFGLPSAAAEVGGSGSRPGECRRIAIYALPFVALAEERARHLETVCAHLSVVRVVCLAGGAPLLLLEDRLNYQHMIYVCTNEKAHALWRELENRRRLHEVAVVVVDEVHYLSDSSRGYVLELFLTSVLRFAASTTPVAMWEASGGPGRKVNDDDDAMLLLESTNPLQLLVTSATIANPQTLAKWCGNAFLFLTDHRPVPLQCYSVLQGRVYNSQQHVVRELTAVAQSEREARRALLQLSPAQVPGIECPQSPATVLRHPLALQPRLEEEEMSLLLALEGWREQFQVLLFVPTRKEAENTARRLATAVAMSRIMKHAPPHEEGDQQAQDSGIGVSSPPQVEFRDSTPAVKEGLHFTTWYGQVGFHHAGLGSKDRIQLEQGYRQGIFWALCCTTTLSTGMNLPCRRVIFTAPRIGISPLDTLTFMQAAGRAGRVGLDPYGEAYVLGKPSERALLRQLARNRLPPIESNFAPEKRGVARVLLDGMASFTSRAPESAGVVLPSCSGEIPAQGLGPREVHRVLLGTLYAVVEREKHRPDSEYAYETGEGSIAAPPPAETGTDVFSPALFDATKHALVLLESNRFISFEVESSCFVLTPLGQATAASLFSPEDALFVLQDLQRSTRQFCLADDLHLLYHCTPLQHDLEPDWHALYHLWGPQLFQGPTAPIIAQVVEVEERTLAAFAMAPPPRRSKHPLVVRCRRLYGALILSETVRERAPADVAQQFGLYGGAPDVLRLMEAAALFASSLARFAHALNWWYLPPLFTIMVVRLRRGVAPELLPLMEIEGLTPWRARELFDRGYRTVRSVVGATSAELEAVFSKHSLQGFQLAAQEPHDIAEEETENREALLWCRGTDYKEVVRQLQHRARLVLVREAKDLETYLLSGQPDGDVSGGIPEKQEKTAALPPPPLTPQEGAVSNQRGLADEGDLESPPHTPHRPSYGRVQLNAELSPWSLLSPSSRTSVVISPLIQRILRQGSSLRHSTAVPDSTHTAICLVDCTDASQVHCFTLQLSRLLDTYGDTKTEQKVKDIPHRRHRPLPSAVTMISLRVIPEKNENLGNSLPRKKMKNEKKGSSATCFTLILGVYQGVRQHERGREQRESGDVMGGVVFYLYHCPARSRRVEPSSMVEATPIYQWWSAWLPTLCTRSPEVEVVWLGLQQQARFLASMGWLRYDALCVHFASPLPLAEKSALKVGRNTPMDSRAETRTWTKRSSAEAETTTGRLPAPHDPLVVLWMLHPEIDTSPLANAKAGALMLPALLRSFPCPVSQAFLSIGSTPPPPPLLASSTSRGAKKDPRQRCVVLSVSELKDVVDRTPEAMKAESPSQSPERRARPSAGSLVAVYTQSAHEESMACLAAAALVCPLLQLLRHEELYESYASRESWMPLICAQMELAGVGFDQTYYPPLMQLMQAKVHELTSYAYEVVGRSNWALTSPRDCAAALYDDLRLPCLHYLGDLDRQQHRDGGAAPLPRRRRLLRENRSTKASVLVQLSRLYPDNPLPQLLMEFRRLDGWTEKYMDPLQRGAVLVRQASSSSSSGTGGGFVLGRRIYGRIYTTATATGRLAMSEPSLQTIPHPVTFELHGRTISVNLRRALIPGLRRSSTTTQLFVDIEAGNKSKRENEEKDAAAEPLTDEETLCFLSADYSHIEARLLAHFSEDEALLTAFPLERCQSKGVKSEPGPGTATNSGVQRDIFKELAADLFDKSTINEVTAEERRIAKSIWYGLMYGRGKNSLANELYLSVEAAERFLHRIRRKYATTLRCMSNMAEEAAERGFVRTLLGRKRWIPRMTAQRRPDATVEERGGWNAFERVAINTLCQASAADIMKEAMVRIALDPLFQGTGASSPVARLVLQVHDELLFEVKKKAIPQVVEALKQHMNLTDQLHLRVPLVINFQCGPSWGEMDPL